MNTIAPFVRIGLRIFGGYMIGKGYATEDDLAYFDDPELIGVIALIISEGWYFLSKRYGWST